MYYFKTSRHKFIHWFSYNLKYHASKMVKLKSEPSVSRTDAEDVVNDFDCWTPQVEGGPDCRGCALIERRSGRVEMLMMAW